MKNIRDYDLPESKIKPPMPLVKPPKSTHKEMTDIEVDLYIANAEIKKLRTELAELRKECDISDAANTALYGALEEEKRKSDAAVECLNVLEPCEFCMHYSEKHICRRPLNYGNCFEWRYETSKWARVLKEKGDLK